MPFSSFAFIQGYSVSGAGTSVADGIYCDLGTAHEGKPEYAKSDFSQYIQWHDFGGGSNSFWGIIPAGSVPWSGAGQWYMVNSASGTPATGSYNNAAVSGSIPYPSVVSDIISCVPPPSPASSTPPVFDNLNTFYSYGLCVGGAMVMALCWYLLMFYWRK